MKSIVSSASFSSYSARPKSFTEVPLAVGHVGLKGGTRALVSAKASDKATPIQARPSGIKALFVQIEAALNPRYSFKAYGERKQAVDQVRGTTAE